MVYHLHTTVCQHSAFDLNHWCGINCIARMCKPLIYCLDKHYTITAKAMGLISSVLDIASVHIMDLHLSFSVPCFYFADNAKC